MGRLTLVMTLVMFLQEAFSRPTWEDSGTHLWVATHSLRSPDLDVLSTVQCKHSNHRLRSEATVPHKPSSYAVPYFKLYLLPSLHNFYDFMQTRDEVVVVETLMALMLHLKSGL